MFAPARENKPVLLPVMATSKLPWIMSPMVREEVLVLERVRASFRVMVPPVKATALAAVLEIVLMPTLPDCTVMLFAKVGAPEFEESVAVALPEMFPSKTVPVPKALPLVMAFTVPAKICRPPVQVVLAPEIVSGEVVLF